MTQSPFLICPRIARKQGDCRALEVAPFQVEVVGLCHGYPFLRYMLIVLPSSVRPNRVLPVDSAQMGRSFFDTGSSVSTRRTSPEPMAPRERAVFTDGIGQHRPRASSILSAVILVIFTSMAGC